MEATRERLCGGRGQIGPTRTLYACAAVNADNGALSGRCWPAHILGAAELYAENPWRDTPEVFTATYQALGAYAWRSDSETARDVTAEPVEFIVNIGDMMQRWTNNRWLSDDPRRLGIKQITLRNHSTARHVYYS